VKAAAKGECLGSTDTMKEPKKAINNTDEDIDSK
jgi:hypothetical protein